VTHVQRALAQLGFETDAALVARFAATRELDPEVTTRLLEEYHRHASRRR
jgi:hypothetical protein